jgi:arylsulfatase A-like enzyme
MKKRINRREFIKLAGLLPFSYLSPTARPNHSFHNGEPFNILIVVFDALSARHVSLYGYQRETMPNLARLADRAVVYHNHYAAGNYTYPGTTSLLTGTYPWTNRGFSPHVGIDEAYNERSIFNAFNQHYRISYTHNPVAQSILNEFKPDIDKFKNRQELYLDHDLISGLLFKNDEDLASVAWSQGIIKRGNSATYSLFLSHLYEWYRQGIMNKFSDVYPRGIPNIRDDNFFLPEDAIDWTQEQLLELPQPFLGYFHYLPPHDPYFTRRDFTDVFKNDGYNPIRKPEHIFSRGRSYEAIREDRRWYDEFILFVDSELGRLYRYLENTGILENTILVFTSDHGEMFERGITKHYNESLHQPVIQVPLLFFEPGRKSRQDIYTPTSAVDILPTLLHINGKDIPEWCDGQVLPPYSAQHQDSSRSVFAIEAKKNKRYKPISMGTLMIVKNQYKLTYYFGYEELKGQGPLFELYDILNDPEEMIELSGSHASLANDLYDELMAELQAADATYSS